MWYPGVAMGGLVASVSGTNPATGSYRYYFPDQHGSVRAMYDGSKNRLASTDT